MLNLVTVKKKKKKKERRRKEMSDSITTLFSTMTSAS